MTHPENEHLIESGLDQVAYLRLVWMEFTIFASIAIVTFPFLVPLDWKAHHEKEAITVANLAKTSLNDLTIGGLKGKVLYYHIAAGYVVTFVVFGLIWWSPLTSLD